MQKIRIIFISIEFCFAARYFKTKSSFEHGHFIEHVKAVTNCAVYKHNKSKELIHMRCPFVVCVRLVVYLF